MPKAIAPGDGEGMLIAGGLPLRSIQTVNLS